MHSITTEKITSEKVEPDTFKPSHHKLKQDIETRLTADKTSIGTTPLIEMTIDTGTFKPVSQKLYPIAMKHYQWVKDKINKLLLAKVI